MRIRILYIIKEFLYIIEKICTLHYLSQTGMSPLHVLHLVWSAYVTSKAIKIDLKVEGFFSTLDASR